MQAKQNGWRFGKWGSLSSLVFWVLIKLLEVHKSSNGKEWSRWIGKIDKNWLSQILMKPISLRRYFCTESGGMFSFPNKHRMKKISHFEVLWNHAKIWQVGPTGCDVALPQVAMCQSCHQMWDPLWWHGSTTGGHVAVCQWYGHDELTVWQGWVGSTTGLRGPIGRCHVDQWDGATWHPYLVKYGWRTGWDSILWRSPCYRQGLPLHRCFSVIIYMIKMVFKV